MKLPLPVLVGVLSSIASTTVLGCSNFQTGPKDAEYKLHGRTMDLGKGAFGIRSVPRGQAGNRYGFVGFELEEVGEDIPRTATAGMNEAGLSCDEQTLEGTRYPKPTSNGTNVFNGFFCSWMLGRFATVVEVKEAMADVTVWGSNELPSHYVARDSNGDSVVLEWLDGELIMHEDSNDGTTGFGIMTNEPPFPYHIANIQHLQWKRGLARQAVPVPGSWYPEERFMRLYMVKEGLPTPTTYTEAVQQAVHMLNVVTVPPGSQYGTDSGSAEGGGDHTLWGVVYDHTPKGPILYWRTAWNQSLQRLRLSDLDLSERAESVFLPVRNDLDWFVDAASSFKPIKE